jgi:hypothetical protein
MKIKQFFSRKVMVVVCLVIVNESYIFFLEWGPIWVFIYL